jgi:hypothetical protein
VQYTYSMQIQGYIAQLFSIEINRKIFITQINYIFTNDKLYCVYPAMSNSLKQLPNFTHRNRNQRCFNGFQVFPLSGKYKDILHNYFPLKLIGKYLLL